MSHNKPPFPAVAAAVAAAVAVLVTAVLTYNIYPSPNESPLNSSITEDELINETSYAATANMGEARLETHDRESAVTTTSEVQDEPPVAEPKAVELPTKRIAVNDPVLYRNIKTRQSTIRRHLNVINDEHSSEREMVGALIGAASLSVVTMYDIEGKSRVIPEMNVDLEAKQSDPYKHRAKQSPWISNDPDTYRFSSGGAVYEIPLGEFPEFDQIDAARKVFGDNIPVGELPIPAIMERIKLVLSYEVQ